MQRQDRRGRRPGCGRRAVLASVAATLAIGGALVSLPGTGGASTTTARVFRASDVPSCHLGNGIQHVVQITFDNVHFFRDNPNVPSDLQLLPNLLNFIQGNGTMLSNNHTPLIAHTADDILTTLTGLYGDRQGMGIANDYESYNPNGTADSAASFAYWTDPIFDTTTPPTAGHDTNPSMVYSPVPPTTASTPVAPTRVTPAPWVPYTRAGCDTGYVATANVDLENTAVDIPKVFGPSSPEEAQLTNELQTDPFADHTTADYIGVSVHCALGSSFCSSAEGQKYNQSSATPTAVADALPQEPRGYDGYQALFGHRYIAPQLGAGTSSLSRNGFQVTNTAGNLVDLNGTQINGAFTSGPGFPGFSHINASQTLAYLADMLESGVPVVSGYISDIHGNERIPALTAIGKACHGAPSALGPGSACYIAQAQYYNAAFGAFFSRLAADGITPANTLFEFSSDEGDHVAGANVGRSIQSTPAGCDGATVAGATVTPDVLCTYPAGTFGELSGNLNGLLAAAGDTTPFSFEQDTSPSLFVTGNPSPGSAEVRAFERDVAGLTSANPYTGTTQRITNYLADPTEEAILHFVNADPARTPTFALFAKPDYFFSPGSASCGGACVVQSPAFAYDHGDYAAEINTNWVGFVGPGVKNLGLDGSAPDQGPSSAGPNSGQGTVPDSGTTGTWVDETDIRPTLLYLAGLHDDYVSDGRVIAQIVDAPNAALRAPGVTALAECYKQLNSSVGVFGTDTLAADTAAIESTSAGDLTYLSTLETLALLQGARDSLANRIKHELSRAAFSDLSIPNVLAQIVSCDAILQDAASLAAG